MIYFWIVLNFAILFCIADPMDNLALLSGTLKTYQKAGCDEEIITIKCPPGTSISIDLAQYGVPANAQFVCPQPGATPDYNDTSACLWPGTMQNDSKKEEKQKKLREAWERISYSLLQTVVEACQKKSQCKIKASPNMFGGDPCPERRKLVEIAYKCRPYEFRSKVVCENDRVYLKCHPNSRIAIFSASFGRTEYESLHCPQAHGVPEETCLASYATETMMSLCHGKRVCDITADTNTLGSPCRPESRMYLKVAYTCVPRRILKDIYEGQLEPDEVEPYQDIFDDDIDPYGKAAIRESAASPPANVDKSVGVGDKGENFTKDYPSLAKNTPKPNGLGFASFQPYTTPRSRYNPFRSSRIPDVQKTIKGMQGDTVSSYDPNCTITVYTNERRIIGFISEWINAYTFVSQNQEKFYLYLTISLAVAIIIGGSILVARLLILRHRARREAKFHATNISDHSLPNGFTDDISEVDADIDLTTPLPTVAIHSSIPPVGSIAEVVRYPAHGHSHTLRRPPSTTATSQQQQQQQYHHHLHQQQQQHQQIQHQDELPRSLSSASNTIYYYG